MQMNLRRNLKKGETVFSQGSTSDCAFIISSGSVEIIENTLEGQKVIGQLTENEIFGEMGLIDGKPRSATARALEDSVVYIMTQVNFDKLARERPEALLPILKVLSGRLRETMNFMRPQYPNLRINTRPVNMKLSISKPMESHHDYEKL
jgi:CRP/FNR family transcriptional regulator, cyclic AMP receptor protein